MPHSATLVRNIAQACETLQSIPRWFHALFAIDLTNKNYAKSKFYPEAVKRFAPFVGTSYEPGVTLSGKPVEVYAIFGGPVAANSFRWPHAIAGTAKLLFVADAGNHRVLGWWYPVTDRPADVVFGQPAFDTNREWLHGKQGAAALRFPYSLAVWDDELSVADTANNRVLHWRSVPTAGAGQPADRVIGQDSFDTNGENRWTAVTHDSLCWPYGVCRHGSKLAVADSGNNRVMIRDLEG